MRNSLNGDGKIGGIDFIKVQVQMIVGDKIYEECLCDSEYILDIIPNVAVAMREMFYWIPKEKTIFSNG